MSIDESCEKIIRQVCKSKLDFHMNQTPYSLYFSIRKKFVKGHVPNSSGEVFRTCESLESELFNVKKEYSKIYKMYEASASEIERLKSELEKKSCVEETITELKKANNSKNSENKGLKKDLYESKDKFDSKCK